MCRCGHAAARSPSGRRLKDTARLQARACGTHASAGARRPPSSPQSAATTTSCRRRARSFRGGGGGGAHGRLPACSPAQPAAASPPTLPPLPGTGTSRHRRRQQPRRACGAAGPRRHGAAGGRRRRRGRHPLLLPPACQTGRAAARRLQALRSGPPRQPAAMPTVGKPPQVAGDAPAPRMGTGKAPPTHANGRPGCRAAPLLTVAVARVDREASWAILINSMHQRAPIERGATANCGLAGLGRRIPAAAAMRAPATEGSGCTCEALDSARRGSGSAMVYLAHGRHMCGVDQAAMPCISRQLERRCLNECHRSGMNGTQASGRHSQLDVHAVVTASAWWRCSGEEGSGGRGGGEGCASSAGGGRCRRCRHVARETLIGPQQCGAGQRLCGAWAKWRRQGSRAAERQRVSRA